MFVLSRIANASARKRVQPADRLLGYRQGTTLGVYQIERLPVTADFFLVAEVAGSDYDADRYLEVLGSNLDATLDIGEIRPTLTTNF